MDAAGDHTLILPSLYKDEGRGLSLLGELIMHPAASSPLPWFSIARGSSCTAWKRSRGIELKKALPDWPSSVRMRGDALSYESNLLRIFVSPETMIASASKPKQVPCSCAEHSPVRTS